MRSVVNVSIVLLLLLTPGLAQAGVQNSDEGSLAAKAGLRQLDCDHGGSLAQLVQFVHDNPAFDGVMFFGTCNLNAPVVIEQDGFRLVGIEGATIAGGGVVVQTADDVTLENFTVRDVGGVGVSVTRNSEVTINGVTAEGSAIGVQIQNSVGRLQDVTVRNGLIEGILVAGSQVTLGGTIELTEAGFIGLDISSGSTVSGDPLGVDIVSTGQGFGVAVQINSSLSLLSGSLMSYENSDMGLIVIGQSSFNQGGSVVARDNGNRGVGFFQTSTWSLFGDADTTTEITGNGLGGAQLVEGSTIIIGGPTEIRNNDGPGMVIDGSVAFLSNLTAENNTTADVFLQLGATVTFDVNNTIDSPILCEGTVLTRGTAGCQTQALQTGQQKAAPSHRSGAEMLEILQRKGR